MSEKNELCVAVSVPTELINEFDAAIEGKYKTRSEAIRAGMRLIIEKQREK